LQNRLIQTSQTGGQWYSDTSPFSIPCFDISQAGGAKSEIFLLSKRSSLLLKTFIYLISEFVSSGKLRRRRHDVVVVFGLLADEHELTTLVENCFSSSLTPRKK
jgi:hypothetical protein